MKSMKQLQDNIDAAKELLEQAEAEYEASMIDLVRSGKVKEVVEAEWKDVYTEDKVKVYCNHCNNYGIGGIKTPICPFCGAVMKNGNALPKKRVAPEAASSSKETVNTEEHQEAALVSQAINYLKDNGHTDEEIMGKISASSASYSRWKRGKSRPQKSHMVRIEEGFRALTGKSIYERGLFS